MKCAPVFDNKQPLRRWQHRDRLVVVVARPIYPVSRVSLAANGSFGDIADGFGESRAKSLVWRLWHINPFGLEPFRRSASSSETSTVPVCCPSLLTYTLIGRPSLSTFEHEIQTTSVSHGLLSLMPQGIVHSRPVAGRYLRSHRNNGILLIHRKVSVAVPTLSHKSIDYGQSHHT